MSATLQALGRTLRQVGELTSERFAAGGMRQRAMLLSGAIALAAVQPRPGRSHRTAAWRAVAYRPPRSAHW